jgi:hypothetical protein
VKVVVVAAEGVPGLLVERARDWARALGDPAPRVARDEPAAAADVTGTTSGVVVVWADTPRLGPVHAAGVQADLAAGTEVVAGPTLDAGVYLLGMRSPRPELVGLRFSAVLERCAASGLETGMLRHERRLARAEDVRALLADPLLPVEVRRVLRG